MGQSRSEAAHEELTNAETRQSRRSSRLRAGFSFSQLIAVGAVKASAGVRISQILVGVVLAFMAVNLYRTSTDTVAVRAAQDTRSLGTRIAQRESVRIDQTIAALQTLKSDLRPGSFDRSAFSTAARSTMRSNPTIDVVDYFDANDNHVAHVDATGKESFGKPPVSPATAIAGSVVGAVSLLLNAAEITGSPAATRALRVRSGGHGRNVTAGLFVYVAQPVAQRKDVVGTIVTRVDVQRLLVSDIANFVPPPDHFVLDDGSGRLETGLVGNRRPPATYAQTFPILFADRVWSLTLAPAPTNQAAKPWLFTLLWLVAWLAVCVPIEVVGQISARVQVLNEGLEARVASRTKQLQESIAELRTLGSVVESVHEGVMIVAADWAVRYANDALCRELGCALGEIVGHKVYECAPLGLPFAQISEIGDLVSARGYAYIELERTRVDGTKYWAGTMFARNTETDAGAGGLIAVSRDVSDMRRLVDELVRAKEELERQMRVRADFIGTASHELRTPATTLRTLSALLGVKVLPRYPFTEEDARLLTMLDFETRRLASLVDDLLEVAKVDATDSPLSESTVDLAAAARAEVEGTFGLDAKAGPAVQMRLPARPAYVLADESALRRVIVNLVGNARKFTTRDGKVTVSIERSGDRVRFVVSDTGIGIPEKDLPHVFERFYRVERSGTEIRGTGLGLAIVARLVERMHGVVSISSDVGKGTTVSVELPAADAAAAAGD